MNQPKSRRLSAAAPQVSLASIFRTCDVAAWGAGRVMISGSGGAWLPGCRAGWAGFHGPLCSPSWPSGWFRLVSRTGGHAGGRLRW
jgi:hypothetical protein